MNLKECSGEGDPKDLSADLYKTPPALNISSNSETAKYIVDSSPDEPSPKDILDTKRDTDMQELLSSDNVL